MPLQPCERLFRGSAPEERQDLALVRVLEPEGDAAVERENREREGEAACDLVDRLTRGADLVQPGEEHARRREKSSTAK